MIIRKQLIGIILLPLLVRFDSILGYGLFGLSELSALGMDELGSRFRPEPGAGSFYWVCL